MIPAIIPPTILTMMKFPKKKILKCLWAMKDVDIGILIPATLHQIITEVVDIGLFRPSTITLLIVEDIIIVMLVEVDIFHKRPETTPLEIGEQELMLKGEVGIGLRPATLPLITYVTRKDF